MSELTNLLPRDRIKAVSREYYLHVATLIAFTLAMLIVAHAALLLPAYLYLSEEVETREAHLAGIAAAFESSEERAASERLSALTASADSLLSLTKLPSASEAIRGVLAVPATGIRLDGFIVTPPESGEGQMRISGIASTRESLRRYHDALSELPFVTKADLPLSVYAGERDIEFSIVLSGSLAP